MKEKMIYNKLIRDKIPEIIEKTGATAEIEIMDDATYEEMLFEKLLEECQEFLHAKSNEEKIEEIADILEVINSISKVLDTNFEHIEKIRIEKKNQRGGFEKKLLLKSTQ